MTNNISHILDKEQISSIKADFDALRLLSRSNSEAAQSMFFMKEWSKLSLLTTNNKPELLEKIRSTFQNKNYAIDMYYTDDLWFGVALDRYKKMDTYDQQLASTQDYKTKVIWKDAIQLIKDTWEERQKRNDADLISELIRLSFQSWASDMHLQCEEDGAYLRLRINWVLESIFMIPYSLYAIYLMKLKYISGVKMNASGLPQDGRFDFQVWTDNNPRKIDARTSFIPSLRWESVVVRFLDSSKSIMSRDEIGFENYHTQLILENLQKRSGMILVTWPTWSGKTTTLYSMINHINNESIKIVTLEDPVEYEIKGIEQSQINEAGGYTFAKGVRSVLRHDPDVILVWEIRDLETANAAINAALTWHLVLSTLHTNSAIEAISRLLNLWVKEYLLAPSINMIIWQRLIRKLWDDKLYKPATKSEIKEVKNYLLYGEKHFKQYIPSFTDKLRYPGKGWYVSRKVVSEVFIPTDETRQMILEGKMGIEIKQKIRLSWYMTMFDDGIIKALKGDTTLEEIKRVLW